MIIVALVACLLQDPAASIDSLVRDLSHDRLDVRERAHVRLLELGTAGVPALKKALLGTDQELRLRVASILDFVERSDRERVHDADQKAALIRVHRNVEAEKQPGSVASEGARFDVKSTPCKEGWILSTGLTDYLARGPAAGPGRGQVRFEVHVTDAEGRDVAVERCGRCSPGKVLVSGAQGPFKVRITGRQTWFSPYPLEYKNPFEGQLKRVGDYAITLAWPSLRITSSSEWPEDWNGSMGARFEFTLKSDVVLGMQGRSFG